mmetsp:Transcript_117041/g.372621  ORF Transcript_117041/g.372621 Transcript_117041/m.372621 type:complete len:746 (+) Transcript_117041:101-2338(+)
MASKSLLEGSVPASCKQQALIKLSNSDRTRDNSHAAQTSTCRKARSRSSSCAKRSLNRRPLQPPLPAAGGRATTTTMCSKPPSLASAAARACQIGDCTCASPRPSGRSSPFSSSSSSDGGPSASTKSSRCSSSRTAVRSDSRRQPISPAKRPAPSAAELDPSPGTVFRALPRAPLLRDHPGCTRSGHGGIEFGAVSSSRLPDRSCASAALSRSSARKDRAARRAEGPLAVWPARSPPTSSPAALRRASGPPQRQAQSARPPGCWPSCHSHSSKNDAKATAPPKAPPAPLSGASSVAPSDALRGAMPAAAESNSAAWATSEATARASAAGRPAAWARGCAQRSTTAASTRPCASRASPCSGRSAASTTRRGEVAWSAEAGWRRGTEARRGSSPAPSKTSEGTASETTNSLNTHARRGVAATSVANRPSLNGFFMHSSSVRPLPLLQPQSLVTLASHLLAVAPPPSTSRPTMRAARSPPGEVPSAAGGGLGNRRARSNNARGSAKQPTAPKARKLAATACKASEVSGPRVLLVAEGAGSQADDLPFGSSRPPLLLPLLLLPPPPLPKLSTPARPVSSSGRRPPTTRLSARASERRGIASFASSPAKPSKSSSASNAPATVEAPRCRRPRSASAHADPTAAASLGASTSRACSAAAACASPPVQRRNSVSRAVRAEVRTIWSPCTACLARDSNKGKRPVALSMHSVTVLASKRSARLFSKDTSHAVSSSSAPPTPRSNNLLRWPPLSK